MENDDEFLLEECDPEKPSTSKAIPTWPSKEAMKDLKSSPDKDKRKLAASEKKVKTAAVDKEKIAAVVKEKPVKAKQAKAPPATAQVDVKSIQSSFGYACMSLSNDLKLTLADEHNFKDMTFTPQVIARTAQIVQTVMESKWAPKLAAFSKHAKRAKITADDARLLFHGNYELLAKIDEASGEAVSATMVRRPYPILLPNMNANVEDDRDKKDEGKLILPRLSPIFSKAPDAQEMCSTTPVRVNEEICSTARSIKSVKLDASAVKKDINSLHAGTSFLSHNQPPADAVISKDQPEQIESRNSDDSFNDDGIFCDDKVNEGLKHQRKEDGLNDGDDSFDNDEIFIDDQDDSLDDILLESDGDNNAKMKEANEIIVKEDEEKWLSKDQARTSLEKQKDDVPIDYASTAVENSVVQQVASSTKSVAAPANKKIPSVTALKDQKGHDHDDSFYNDDDIDVGMGVDGSKEDKKLTDDEDEILWESYTDDNDAAKNLPKNQTASKAIVSASLNQPPASKLVSGDRKSFSQIRSKRPTDESSATPLLKVRKTSETVITNGPKEDPSSKKQWNPFKPMQITPPSDNFLEKRQLSSAKKSTDLEKKLSYRSDDSLFDDDDGLF